MATSKKKPKRRPTIKQKKALDNVVENGGNVYKAMIDAGYSPATAKTPQKLTESMAWKEIMEEHLPDEVLAKLHARLLNKEEVIVRNNVSTGEIEVIPTGQIDVQAVKAGLDMAYKLKGSYAPEKSVIANFNIDGKKQKQTNKLIDRILGDKEDSE